MHYSYKGSTTCRQRSTSKSIKNCWPKLETLLRQTTACSRDTLDDALKFVINRITGSVAQGWFRHRGYAVH